MLNKDSVQEQFENALDDNAGLFVASLIDVYGSDSSLQKCDPKAVIMEALKAATLQLPINKSLGFAWIVPYKGQPQMQVGYRGFIQLAMRTGLYKHINADVVHEGELQGVDKLTGEIDLSGEKTSDNVVGYFAFIETTNGFRKAIYWSKEEVVAHAQKFSQSFKNKNSAWQTNFDAMARKTVLSSLLRTYGIMSVEMQQGITSDGDIASYEEAVEAEVEAEANSEVIDVEPKYQDEPTDADEPEDEEKPEPEPEPEKEEQSEGPGF
jgi:recombination protein RecT